MLANDPRQIKLNSADERLIEKELCKRSLAFFAQQAWHVLEPSTPLKWGWALDAICEHLEAVTERKIGNLMMNVPPGSMKSLLTGVIWPAWEWGPRDLQHYRYLGTAHKESLAIRDSLKCRRLIQSEWYQKRWPIRFTTDQNAKTKFENDRTGFRESMAFVSLTGSRGDRVILDDPLSVDDANSDAELAAVEKTFTEALPTRVNNDLSSIVVIMQRLHERDVSGIIMDRGLDYEKLVIPMRFEEDRRCVTSIGWKDPRTQEGELMFPERFPEVQVQRLEATMGSYAAAGQLQQRPAPRGGGMLQKGWFEVVHAVPAGCRWARGWDLAATKSNKAAYTAGALLGMTPDKKFILADMKRIRGTAGEVERLLVNTASQDKAQWGWVKGDLPQDPGQAGKAQVQYLISQLAGYDYQASPESGDKITRAQPFAAQAQAGNVMLLAGDWNEAFLDEASTFPVGKYKDQIDAVSRAFSRLVNTPTYNIHALAS